MSFQSNDQFTETLISGADLRNNAQFRFVKLNGAGRVVRCDTAGERAYGMLLNKPNDGETANVVTAPGGSMITLGGNVTGAGVELTTDNQGRAIAATVNKQYVNAIAKKGGSAGDEVGANGVTYQKNV